MTAPKVYRVVFTPHGQEPVVINGVSDITSEWRLNGVSCVDITCADPSESQRFPAGTKGMLSITDGHRITIYHHCVIDSDSTDVFAVKTIRFLAY